VKKLSLSLALSLVFAMPAIAQEANNDVRVTPEGVWYTVSRDETLSEVAQRFTGSVRHWHAIGTANRIQNERKIPIGRTVLIPAALLTPVAAYAHIDSFSGGVIVRNQQGQTVEVKTGAQLQEGDTVTTMADSFISFILADGSRVTLPPRSTLNLRTLRTTEYLHSPRINLFLQQGRVESLVTPLTNADGRYEVHTPHAASSVRGTRFRVQYQEEGQRTLDEVVEGKVAVQAGHTANTKGMQLVSAGFGTVVENGRSTKPVPLLPAPEVSGHQALQQRLPIRFALEESGAAGFHIQVSTDVEGVHRIEEAHADAIDGKGEVRIADLPDGHYVAHINAVDKNGLGGMSRTFPFEVAARPFPPFLLAPAAHFQGNVPGTSVQVPVQWSLSGEARRYRLQITSEQDPDFTHPEYDQTVDVEELNGQAIVTLTPGMHIWRVATIDARNGHQGPFSDARQVDVIPGLAAPAATLDDKEMHFAWSASAPGQHFVFQFAQTPDFSNLLHEIKTDTATATVPRPQPGTYHARVRSIDADGFSGPFSPSQEVVIPLQWQSGDGQPVQAQEQPLGSRF